MSRAADVGTALRTIIRAPLDFPRELERLLAAIGDQQEAAAELRAACRSNTISDVIACTDEAGEFR